MTNKMDEYDRLCQAKRELHNLMRRVVQSTKLGVQRRRPDDDIDIEIGNGDLGSCARYGQVRYYPQGMNGEYELDNDLESIEYLVKEIKLRFSKFQKDRNSKKLEYVQGKKKFAQKHFSKLLIKLDEEYR